MLKMAGVHMHPGIRIVLGVLLVLAGLLAHKATPLIVIGAVLTVLGLASVAGYAAGSPDEHNRR